MRVHATDALARYVPKVERATEALANIIGHRDLPIAVLCQAAQSIGHVYHEKAIPHLRLLLDHSNETVVETATLYLGVSFSPSVVPDLIRVASNPQARWKVDFNCLQALKGINDIWNLV